ncbi:hypothetical protein SD961_06500 [Erwinia sp. MMLR14_017]|uniref:hypothetical protein n=1 Tax=Erwinia sp. MMLR14_017 TaxID=3093842 RepID=UPI00298FD0BB|nr:hypothetical protein [Erwinia sp. MMLR14_017]MDW8845551.1 hypothetical protein [Erwinia sp. MMLR14_017]
MSAKSQFLKKLQSRQIAPASFSSKSQIDIATFRLRMEQLQEQMDEWLVGTGLNMEKLTVPVTDLLVEGGAFNISAIVLSYENRAIKFLPIFLYSQGVTGGVEITLHAGGGVTTLGRLFMRAGNVSDWTFNPHSTLPRAGRIFDEDTFFRLITSLLP